MRCRTDNPNGHRRDNPGISVVRLGLMCWLATATLAAPASAQAIPAHAQLPIYFKVLAYDRTLWDDPEPPLRVGLLHRLDSEASRRNLAAMITSLEALATRTINGVAFEYVTLAWSRADDLVRQLVIADLDVLYVTEGHRDVLDQLSVTTRAHGVLTLAGAAGDVGHGLSVGLELEDGRPRLAVDLAALAAEGHQIDSRVLRLCRVVAR